MDDRQTYLLNGLIARQFGLGRIVRFRQIERGRQAECFELFTAQEKEYLIQLYPTTFSAESLEFVAQAVNLLDQHRFSVVPFLPAKAGQFAAEGLQNKHMLVGLAPEGSSLNPKEYTEQEIAQVGLRPGWMHRLLKEHLPMPTAQATLAERFQDAFFERGPDGERVIPTDDGKFKDLLGLIGLAPSEGWAHGDLTPAALLHDGDRQLRSVTDWGLLHWGCPLEDLVDAFMFLATDKTGALDRARGSALLEAYHSLVPLKGTPWTPVVACWCAHRMLSDRQRELTVEPFGQVMRAPERLATAIASCL